MSRSPAFAPRLTGIQAWCGGPGVRLLRTVEEGAQAILNLATSPAVDGQTGVYFNGLREATAQAQAYDPDARQRLQALSVELTGLSAEVAALDR